MSDVKSATTVTEDPCEGEKPPEPSTASRKLYFEPQEMVEWLSPFELLRTAREVVISGIFGSFADKREVQAAIALTEPTKPTADYSGKEDVWVDYVSDLGDGFNPTYTVARAIAQEKLLLELDENTSTETHRAGVLIMGGDQVYPTATVESYRNRLIGPYRAALPEMEPPLELFAVPGNHDWYDGLTSFMRIFCQQGWIGAWKTTQSRSYFSLKLPGQWWIWGIDIQFDTYIDWPQLTYFQALAETLQPGDAIILCTAKPSWVSGHQRPDEYANLSFFEKKLNLTENGATIKLMLTGDTHHYAHYVEVGGDGHKITAGGGGAYLSATHHLPCYLQTPPAGMRDPSGLAEQTFKLKARYPSAPVSRRLRKGVFGLYKKNPGFVGLMAFVQLLFVLAFHGDQPLRSPFFWQDLKALFGVHPVWLTVLILLVIGTWVGFVQKAPSWALRIRLGLLHGGAQVVLALTAASLALWSADRSDGLITGQFGSSLPVRTAAWLLGAMVTMLVIAVGGLLASMVTALYLFWADRKRCNTNELFSAQSIEGYKNFVRLHFTGSKLMIYPIGIDEPGDWTMIEPNNDEERYNPQFRAAVAEPVPHLIEHPFEMDNTPGELATPADPEDL